MVTIEDLSPTTFLVKNASKDLSNKLKFAIPTGSRSYTENGWVVRKDFLEQVKSWIRFYNQEVKDQTTKSKTEDYYKALHLTPDAPIFLVDATWKLLARKYHPDSVDGNQELFIQYKTAYEKIRR